MTLSYIYCLMIVLSSWAIGGILTQLIGIKSICAHLVMPVVIRSHALNRFLGVNAFKYLVTKTFYGKINRNIKVYGRTWNQLTRLRQEMIKSEFGHATGFVSAQLIFLVIYKLNHDNMFLAAGTAFNILLNVYPVLLQQKNRHRIDCLIHRPDHHP